MVQPSTLGQSIEVTIRLPILPQVLLSFAYCSGVNRKYTPPLPISIACSSICRASDVPHASPRRANSLIFSGISERERPWQWSLQVSFRELHLPATAKEECHIDGVVRFGVAAHTQTV